MAINFPSSPSVNDTVTDSGKTWVWNGTYWKMVGSSNRGISLEISDASPSQPIEGDMWFESDTGRTFTYYDGAWVELGGGVLIASTVADADADTLIQVEKSTDEDVIRFDVAGSEKAYINSSGVTVSGDLSVSGNITGVEDKSPMIMLLMGV